MTAGPASAWRQFAGCALVAALTAVLVVVAQNLLIARAFPHTARLATQFSPAYLKRELAWLRSTPGQTLFLGDSILWGFRLPPSQTAVAVMAAGGCDCRNLAYKHGSPVNYYALVRLLQHGGVRPHAVVLEINREVFGPAAESYRELTGTVAQLAAPLLDDDDRATFAPAPRRGLRATLDGALAKGSALYAMRTDIREAIYGDADPAPPPLAPGLIRRLYDLPPLDEANVSVRYLEKTLGLLRAAGTPVVAFLTPINHTAIDPYVDATRYRRNTAYLQALLARGGAQALDLDGAFGPAQFVDEAHLNAAGQERLATILHRALARTEP